MSNDLNVHETKHHEEEEQQPTVFVSTHEKINHTLCGDVELIETGHVIVSLITTEDMRADDVGLVHGGFIFSSADYAAMLAVNEKNVVLASSTIQFLAPIRVGDEIRFEAQVRHKEGRKRNVRVIGISKEVKVFEGEFKTVVTDRHVLRLNLLDIESMEEN